MQGTGIPDAVGPVVDPSAGTLAANVDANPQLEAAEQHAVEEGDQASASDVELFERPPQQPVQDVRDLGTAEIDEAEAAVEEEQFPSSRDIPSGGVRPTESVIDFSEWRCHVLHNERLVPLDLLCFDKGADHGQVRPLRPEIVKYYVQRLITMGEPVRPVDVMTKQTSGVCVWCSG